MTHYRPDIDGLRAIAIMMVVIYHFFPTFLPSGFVGVDIFFVISGYLISGNLFRSFEENSFSLADFYARRFKRILPALSVMLISVFLAEFFFESADLFVQFGKHLIAGASFTENFLLARQAGYFDVANSFKPLMHLWTLGVEEQFYFVWPLVLWSTYRLKISLRSVIVYPLLLSFLANILTYDAHPVGSFYYLPSRFWELLVGGILAYYQLYALRLSISFKIPDYVFSVFAFFISLAILFFINEHTAFPKWYAILPVILGASVITAGPKSWINKKMLSSPPFVWLGKLSYPLYLWHWPLVVFRAESEKNHFYDGSLFLILLAIVLSWFTHVLVEKPIQSRLKWIKGHANLPRRVVAFSIFLSGCFSLVGALAYSRHLKSFDEFRFPKISKVSGYSTYDISPTRLGRCFIDTSQEFMPFSPECYQSSSQKLKKILLLGDSNSAHFYPGLKAITLNSGYGLFQMSGSDCPIFFSSSSDSTLNCNRVKAFSLQKMIELRPEVIVLSMRWASYIDRAGFWPELARAIERFKAIGARKIIIIGQDTNWTLKLPKLIAENFIRRNIEVPNYSEIGVKPEIFQVDRELSEKSAQYGYQYISLLTSLCDVHRSCRILAGENLDSGLMVYDAEHFTTEGSIRAASAVQSSFMTAIQLDQGVNR